MSSRWPGGSLLHKSKLQILQLQYQAINTVIPLCDLHSNKILNESPSEMSSQWTAVIYQAQASIYHISENSIFFNNWIHNCDICFYKVIFKRGQTKISIKVLILD